MGVSFKISKAGRRFIPKPIASSSSANNTFEEEEEEEKTNNNKNESTKLQSAAPVSTSNLKVNVTSMDVKEDEVSFTLLLFPDGYSIGRPSENRPSYQTMLQDAPKFLHPYDRASEALFSAIECGRLPGDILDDIPCKYVNGTVVCEVRDYRNCSSDDGPPITNKVCLKMSLENIVKDIPMLSNDSWTYGDLMEVEARIVKTLQPQLCLDPSPKLDRLCENPVQKKLNLDIGSLRRKRRGEKAGVIVTSSNELHGKKACIDRVSERSGDAGPISGNIMTQHVHDNAHVMGSNNASLSSLPFVSQQSKYQMGYADGMNLGVSSVHARRENQDDPSSPASNLSKRAKLTSLGPDGIQQQHMGAPMDNLQGSDLQWKNSLLQQQQFVGRGFQYANNGLQKLPQQIYEGGLTNENSEFIKARATTQQGIRFPKEEPVESDKSELYQNRNESLMVDAERNRMQQRLPPPQHAFMRPNFTQPPWNTFGQPMENNLQKKKSVPSPRGGLPSPLSSKSQEFSSSSVGPQFGPVGVASSHKDKTQATSVPTVGGATSLTSSANDNSMQRQQQVQLAAKRRSNSHPKPSTMSGVGSPASVSNMSPADEMLPQADPKMLDIFSKVELVAARHQINHRKNKVDEKQTRKPAIYRPQQIMIQLSGDSSGENFIDDSENKELAKSLVGGSMNACKIRVLTFVQNERIMQGNGFALVPKSRIRMILSANPSEGTIAMYYGDILESESIFSEENLPTLPNAHLADLLAAQLSSLMTHDGFEIEDKIHPKPVRANHAQQNTCNNNVEQYSDVNTGQQQYNEVARPNNSVNSPLTPNQNLHSPRMLPPQNLHALQMSQGFGSGSARPQQNEPQSLSQQQPNQFQRSQVMLPSNQLSQANPLGQNTNPLLANNQMIYKQSQSHLQMQLMQQQQQQQPQRKMMMGMGANMGNNVVGLGGLSNVMGMRAPTMSGPMGSISGLSQNPMNLSGSSNISNQISQQIRNGQLTTQALMTAKLRMANRGMMGGGAQTNLGGISGARQMHPGSSGIPMLGHSLNNRGMGPMNPMQRSGVGPMGPPKLMTGMNPYINLQLQQQQQQQMQFQTQQIQQQQQFQQQQLQQQQQQDSASPLQAVVSSPQQLNQQSQQQQLQQASPQQMSQLTPMSPQLSSGITMGNVEAACPASPQLSSQTLGSVSNIANSPMEQLQGSNKNSDMHS